MISKEELERARKIFAEAEINEKIQIQKFWAEIYPSYTKEEKAKYWSGTLHRMMRYNGESGFNEEAAISKQYEALKLDEPQIDDLLEDIAKYLRYKPEDFIRILKEGK